MKHPHRSFLRAAAALIFLFNIQCSDTPALSEEVLWIHENAYQPRSVNPADTDFSDLRFLKKIINNKRLVLLGEQSHGDGTTFQAKTRLIKFLHEEMDFDIIAFESGIYDCHKTWLDIRSGMDPVQAAQKGITSVWSRTDEVSLLFDYLGKAPYGLELAGVDHQFFGSYKSKLTADLEVFLSARNSAIVSDEQWPDDKTLLNQLLNTLFDPAALDAANLASAIDLLDKLIGEIESFDQAAQDQLLTDASFWTVVLKNVKMDARVNQLWKNGDRSGHNLRSVQMAENLSWLMERYDTKKIIVWTASSHIARNIDDAEYYDRSTKEYQPLSPGYKPMGDHLFEKYGDDLYTIGFTAFEGSFYNYQTGSYQVIQTPPEGSLEEILSRKEAEYLFINYRAELPPWLSEEMVALPLGYTWVKNDWANTFDGIFYTRKMRGSQFIR